MTAVESFAPLRLGTGFSKRMRRVFVNLEGTERIYTKGAGPMCPRDGYVVFRNSELLCGRLGKQTLGGGNKASLFQARPATVAVACARKVTSDLTLSPVEVRAVRLSWHTA